MAAFDSRYRTIRSSLGDEQVPPIALLAQLHALRAGRGDFALFAEIAAPRLDEKELFIGKAIGLVLREVSQKRPALVRDSSGMATASRDS
jgi:3-methyladenine DNA glycosylase AlkD